MPTFRARRARDVRHEIAHVLELYEALSADEESATYYPEEDRHEHRAEGQRPARADRSDAG